MKGFRVLLSLIVAALFFGGVLWLSGVHVRDVVDLLKTCDPTWLLAALGAYILSYAGRALRFKVLLKDENIPFSRLYSTVTVHNLFNAVLPARTGELSYIYLLKKKFKVAAASGVATLVVARVMDLLSLMLYLAIGLAFYGARMELLDSQTTIYLTCAGVIVIALVILFNLASITGVCLNVFRALARSINMEERGPVPFILRKGTEVRQAFQSIESRGLLLSAFSITAMVWLCTYATCYCILLSFDEVDVARISFGISIVGTTALHATNILPINSFGNLGTWEAGWAAGYILIGMDEQLAVKTGMGEHVIIFAFLFVLGLIGWLSLRKRQE